MSDLRCPRCGGRELVQVHLSDGNYRCPKCEVVFMFSACQGMYNLRVQEARMLCAGLGNLSHINRGPVGDLCHEVHEILAKGLEDLE